MIFCLEKFKKCFRNLE